MPNQPDRNRQALRHPHLVFLTADQMRFDCLSCHGNLGMRTPHLDALASERRVFDHTYCSTPLCIPTRTSIATGQWPHTTRAITNGGQVSPAEIPWRSIGPETPTLYECLARAGYRITHVGIQHIFAEPSLVQRVPAADMEDSHDHERHMEIQGLPAGYQIDQRVTVIDFDNGRMFLKPRWTSPKVVQRFNHAPELFKDL